MAQSAEEYTRYPICSIFGTFPENNGFTVATPTRLTVRDVPLTAQSAKELNALKTDLPYTEVKWEASIDRVTSAASPRQIERVPAGAVFGPASLIFSVYSAPDQAAGDVAVLFTHVIEALEYLEDDYLGGMGTRGNGRVQFTDLTLTVRRIKPDQGYMAEVPYNLDGQRVSAINRDTLKGWLQQQFA